MRTTLARVILSASWPAAAAAAESPPHSVVPAVVVLVADQGPFDARPVPWWVPGKGSASPTRAGDSAVAAALGDGSMRLLDATPKAGRIAALGVSGAPLSPERARELARLVGADVVVHGTAVAADEEDSGGVLEQASGMKGSSTGRPCTVAVTLRAYRADTGQVLADARTSARSTAFRSADCTRTAAAKAAQAIAPEFRERILAYWLARSRS